jgi:hypothetical protein
VLVILNGELHRLTPAQWRRIQPPPAPVKAWRALQLAQEGLAPAGALYGPPAGSHTPTTKG